MEQSSPLAQRLCKRRENSNWVRDKILWIIEESESTKTKQPKKLGEFSSKINLKLGPQFPDGTIQLVPEPGRMVIIIARRWRGTWEGVSMATWCSEWICRRGGGLVHHIVIFPPTLSLLLLLGAAVRRAPTILPIDRFCTRFSSFSILQFFQPLGPTVDPMDFQQSCGNPKAFWCSEIQDIRATGDRLAPC